MIELITEQGWKFNSSAFVHIGDKCYDMDDLTEGQSLFVSGKLQEQALNAAFAGKATFTAKGLPSLEEVFPQR